MKVLRPGECRTSYDGGAPPSAIGASIAGDGAGVGVHTFPLSSSRRYSTSPHGSLISQGAELGQSLGEPDPETIERIGVLPKEEPLSTGADDIVSSMETAWVR